MQALIKKRIGGEKSSYSKSLRRIGKYMECIADFSNKNLSSSYRIKEYFNEGKNFEWEKKKDTNSKYYYTNENSMCFLAIMNFPYEASFFEEEEFLKKIYRE